MRKKAFVTGASSGIGRGIVQVLSDKGYDVAFTYNTKEEPAKALWQEVKDKGVNCYYFQASLDEKGVAETVTAQAIEALGGIDLMVSNAGVTQHNSLLTLTHEFMDFLFQLNFKSYLLCAKTAANYMVEHNIKGNILFITSTRGYRAYPNDAIYGAFKAGLIRAAESFAIEMGPYGIRVNTVAPGCTYVGDEMDEKALTGPSFTEDIPLQRLGTPREVGYLVEYIASNKAAYMTGNTIKLDGGLILPGMEEIWD